MSISRKGRRSEDRKTYIDHHSDDRHGSLSRGASLQLSSTTRTAATSTRPRIEVKVAPGMTFNQVQADLVEKGIVTNPELFRWAAYLTRREDKIQTGKVPLPVRGERLVCPAQAHSRRGGVYPRSRPRGPLYDRDRLSAPEECGSRFGRVHGDGDRFAVRDRAWA